MDVNPVFYPISDSIHGQAVSADRAFSAVTIRAHYTGGAVPRRSVVFLCGLTVTFIGAPK